MNPSLTELFEVSTRTLTDLHPMFKKPIFSTRIAQMLMYVFITTGLFFIIARFTKLSEQVELEETKIDEKYLNNSFKEVIFSVVVTLPIVIGLYVM